MIAPSVKRRVYALWIDGISMFALCEEYGISLAQFEDWIREEFAMRKVRRRKHDKPAN